MHERTIKLLATLIFLGGIAALLFLVNNASDGTALDGATIEKMGDPSIGSRVTVEGRVALLTDKGTVSFLKLSPASPYPLVSFDPLDVEKGDTVKVTGKIKEYKGKLEIVIETITKES